MFKTIIDKIETKMDELDSGRVVANDYFTLNIELTPGAVDDLFLDVESIQKCVDGDLKSCELDLEKYPIIDAKADGIALRRLNIKSAKVKRAKDIDTGYPILSLSVYFTTDNETHTAIRDRLSMELDVHWEKSQLELGV